MPEPLVPGFFIPTLPPKETFVEENQKMLDEIEEKMICALSPDQKTSVINTGKELLNEQSIKEDENNIACLPSLTIADIVETAPTFQVETHQSSDFSCGYAVGYS